MPRKASFVWTSFALLAVIPGAMALGRDRREPAAVPVRYIEGMVHGFLELSTEGGMVLSHGDLFQVPKDGGIWSRMLFHMDKASVFDETVTYTQRGTFEMQTYRLIQSGPAFAEDLDASLLRSGSYVVKTKSHKDGEEHTYSGTMPLPADVYNGMAITVAKNISPKDTTTVHIVAFTPQPHVIDLVFSPSKAEPVMIGKHAEDAVVFRLTPRPAFLLRMGARLTGKMPSDTRIWIVTEGVPAFVRSLGPLYSGPAWRIALTSPASPK